MITYKTAISLREEIGCVLDDVTVLREQEDVEPNLIRLVATTAFLHWLSEHVKGYEIVCVKSPRLHKALSLSKERIDVSILKWLFFSSTWLHNESSVGAQWPQFVRKIIRPLISRSLTPWALMVWNGQNPELRVISRYERFFYF